MRLDGSFLLRFSKAPGAGNEGNDIPVIPLFLNEFCFVDIETILYHIPLDKNERRNLNHNTLRREDDFSEFIIAKKGLITQVTSKKGK